jgi:hypothetical protein
MASKVNTHAFTWRRARRRARRGRGRMPGVSKWVLLVEKHAESVRLVDHLLELLLKVPIRGL